MKRRTWLVGAALCAVPLATAVPAAGAGAGKGTIKLECSTNVSVMIAGGDSGVTPPAQSGTEYGSAACGKLLGSGIQKDSFSVPDSGDTVASYRMFFSTGSIHGKYVLSPQEGSFGGTGFTGTEYVGKLTVTGGTGAFSGAKGQGTMKCSSADNIHTTCTDRLRLKQL